MEQEQAIEEKEPEGVPAVASIFLLGIIWFMSMMILTGGVQLLSLGLGTEKAMSLMESSYAAFYLNVIVMLASTVLASVVMMKCVDHRPLSDLGFAWRGRGKDLLYGLLVAGGIYLTGFVLSLWMGVVCVSGIRFAAGDLAASFLLFVLVAVNEELLMRGYVLGRLLRTRMNRFLALAISSVLFTSLHLFNPNLAFFPLLNLTLAGCLLGASFLYTRNLVFPISLHLFWNWIQGPVLGYEVSGMNIGQGVFRLDMSDPSIWNGGAFGFEGSVLCTVLCVAATLGIIAYFERRKATPAADLPEG